MLYYLFQWLDKYDFPGAGMFGYTSFRSLMAIILALLISSIWGDKFINLLKRKQITETQRDASIDPFGVRSEEHTSELQSRQYLVCGLLL